MLKDLDQLKELMSGIRKPTTDIEKIFMVGYNHALLNLDLLEKYIELSGELDYYEDAQKWHAAIIGYAMGQKQLSEEIANYKEEDQNTH